MSSHQNNPGLVAPLASLISQDNKPKESWYSLNALARGSVEILLYDEIGAWGITPQQFAKDLKAAGDVKQINLRIHSPGGDVFGGIAIFNLLKSHPANIDVFIDGLAASMASVIAMVGTVHIPENAMMMVHRPWGIQGGDADDMRRYGDLLDKVEGQLIAAYVDKTGQTPEAIATLLKNTTWMTGREAVEAGFADHVTEPLAAAAQLTSKRFKEFENMPDSLKSLLDPQGNGNTPAPSPTPTPAPAPAPAPTPAPAPAPEAHATAEIRAQVLAAETNRRLSITTAFGSFGQSHAELLNTCLLDHTVTPEQASQKLLAKLGESTTPAPRVPGHITNGNLVGDSVRASLMARARHGEMEPSNAFNHMSLRELARASLTERGVGIAGLAPLQMVGLAFTHSTSDFGGILLDVANKSIIQGWEAAEETFPLWTKKGELSDFKVTRRVGLGEFNSLRQVREGAEYKYITIGELGAQVVLATYGELFSITRQAIINDDMSMLTDIPNKMGQAAKGTIGDLVFAVLTGNPVMADGKTLFHADHRNLQTGASSALSIDSLSKMKTQMATQKGDAADGKGRNLNIRPAYILTPIALEDKANQIINSESVPGADVNSGIVNPIRGFAKVIGDARLDDASATAWYGAARQGLDTIEVSYLNGVETPYLEQQQGFTVDGVASKVRIDAGVAPLDYRGLQKANGA
ncbi:MAG: ClpP-like prohead protease/major capsid protein fusion protein [Phyllobacterium sp.]|uniref:ClpP-like prohead protease/major capsid protein fusion protein n=1 Tax=Phyllobacterium sp. TaxID=1871046 RepID=UPI0030F28EEA